MPYSDKELDAMQYDPIATRGYYWRCAMAARRRALIATREIVERGRYSPTTLFAEVYEADGEARERADLDMRVSEMIMEHIDAMVRSSLERPKVCKACRNITAQARAA